MMVPVGHEEKIASKVTEILQLRPDAYEELAQASQNVADRFRWDEIAEQYLARVEELRA
jgi:glycosyltransferase involved in cell wall biosynthesis